MTEIASETKTIFYVVILCVLYMIHYSFQYFLTQSTLLWLFFHTANHFHIKSHSFQFNISKYQMSRAIFLYDLFK